MEQYQIVVLTGLPPIASRKADVRNPKTEKLIGKEGRTHSFPATNGQTVEFCGNIVMVFKDVSS